MTPEWIEEKKQIAVTVSRMPEEKINDLYDKICELAHAEDGEQLEDILSEFNLMNVGYDAAWDEVERLLAALEESQQRIGKLELYVKSLEFNREDTQKRANEKLKGRDTELVEAQQTIARQREVLEFYANQEHWELPSFGRGQSKVTSDRGSKARDLLEEGSDKA
ncbi:hypothetical protein [Paenibacillus odorifer]|uniref:hypothetical protein n=2 Tax=Paenibacillus TaxID=44249 RepID=UPI001C4C0B3C|nr:hypothetical protein [Paenibacillus odorifer]